MCPLELCPELWTWKISPRQVDRVVNNTRQRPSLLTTPTTVDASWLFTARRSTVTRYLSLRFAVDLLHCLCLQCFDAEWWGAGVVICLQRDADLHIAQLMPLPRTVSCFSKIQIGFTFLVPAHLGSPGKGPLNWCVYCCMYLLLCAYQINNNNNKSVCFVHVFKMQKPRRRTILMRGWIFSCRGRSWLS